MNDIGQCHQSHLNEYRRLRARTERYRQQFRDGAISAKEYAARLVTLPPYGLDEEGET